MGNPLGMFKRDPQDLPGQGLARADNYNQGAASGEYGNLIKDLYGNQAYMLNQEQYYNPQWLALQQQQSQVAQQGSLNLYGQAIPQLSAYQNQANALQQAGTAQNWTNNGAAVTQGYRAINPQQTALYDSLLGQANQQLAMGTQLRPDEVRGISQSVRSNFANRGLGNSNAGQLAEAMQLYGAGENMYQQRLGNAMNLANQQQAFYSPVTAMMGAQSAIPGQAQTWNTYAQQLAGAGPSQLSAQTQAAMLNNVYGQNQQNNRATATNETQLAGKYIDMMGNLMGGGMCWAAREVFGAEDIRWLQFREWLLDAAPRKLRQWYRENGEKLAAALKANPQEKGWVREFMQQKIKEMNYGIA